MPLPDPDLRPLPSRIWGQVFGGIALVAFVGYCLLLWASS